MLQRCNHNGKHVKKRLFNANGVAKKEDVIFIYSGDKLVAEWSTEPPQTNPTTKYVATDTLGSVRAITDSSGTVISRSDFMPFGEELQADANYRKTNLKYNPDDVRQKFTGYQKDEETGLDFAEARMYNNAHARFTAVDPLIISGKSANPQTFNRYVYVANNPINYIDPDGLQMGESLKGDNRRLNPPKAKVPQEKRNIPGSATDKYEIFDNFSVKYSPSGKIDKYKAAAVTLTGNMVSTIKEQANIFYDRGQREAILFTAAITQINGAISNLNRIINNSSTRVPAAIVDLRNDLQVMEMAAILGDPIVDITGRGVSVGGSVDIGVAGAGSSLGLSATREALSAITAYNDYLNETETLLLTEAKNFSQSFSDELVNAQAFTHTYPDDGYWKADFLKVKLYPKTLETIFIRKMRAAREAGRDN